MNARISALALIASLLLGAAAVTVAVMATPADARGGEYYGCGYCGGGYYGANLTVNAPN